MFIETFDGGLINLKQYNSVEVARHRDRSYVAAYDTRNATKLFAGSEEECEFFLFAVIKALKANQNVATYEELTRRPQELDPPDDAAIREMSKSVIRDYHPGIRPWVHG